MSAETEEAARAECIRLYNHSPESVRVWTEEAD